MKHSKKLLKTFVKSSGILELKKDEQAKIKGGSDASDSGNTINDSITEDIDTV